MFKKLFHELRRREVFRTAGLYVGIAWITIEVSSVLLPAFDLPDSVLRWLVILAIVGFPISLVLAWVFDISDRGIVVQQDADEAAAEPVGGYTMDFVVIGVLSVALIVSVYLNFTAEPGAVEATEPVTVLVTDVVDQTGNSVLGTTLTEAAILGLDVSPMLNLQNLVGYELLLPAVAPGAAVNPLLLQPQDAQVLVSGSVTVEGSGLRLQLQAVEQASGETLWEDDARVANPSELLAAIDKLLDELRDTLGATGDTDLPRFSGERAMTQSIEALQSFSNAEALARSTDYAGALQQYQRATELDPQFARAWYGAALAAFAAGQAASANELWQKAESLQARVNARTLQRLRGRYYTTLQVNYPRAIEQYEQLVSARPADGAALNALARLYRATGQHDKAFARASALLALSPDSAALRMRHAEFALYASKFDIAAASATALVDELPNSDLPRLILAIVALHKGDIAAAQGQYRHIAESSVQGASLAALGLADIALFEQRYEEAVTLLTDGIVADGAAANEYGIVSKRVALAQAYAGQQTNDAALRELQALAEPAALPQLVQAAEIYVAQGRATDATAIAAQLRELPGPAAAAYAAMIDGLLAYHDGNYTAAIDAYRSALRKADLWLVRLHIGDAYLKAGYPAEASDEYVSCLARRGEAGSLFFDRLPSWRYTAGLAERKAAADREFLGGAAASAARDAFGPVLPVNAPAALL